MAIRLVDDVRIAIWGETSPGVRPSPVTKAAQIPIISASLSRTQERVEPEVIVGNKMPARPARGLYGVKDQQLVVPMQTTQVGIWLYKAFEQYSVSGTADPYTHIFKAGGAFHAAGPYLGAEVWHNGAGKGDVLDGLAITGIAWEIEEQDREARITVTLSGLGKGEWDTSTRQDSTPTIYTTPFWIERDAIVKINGVQASYIVSASVQMRRKYSVRKVHDGTDYASFCVLGGLEPIQVRLRGLWDDTSEVRALATGEGEHSVELIFKEPGSTTHDLSIKLPEVQAFITSAPAIGKGTELEIELEGVAYYQDNTDNSCIIVTLKDPLATYVDYIQ